MFPVRRQISPHAGNLRRNSTDAERMMWAILRNRQIDGYKFRRQATIGPFIVDFFCVEAALAIELDGGQHNEDRDAERTAFLGSKQFSIMRFWNHEIMTNIDGVVETIHIALQQKKTLTLEQRHGSLFNSPAKAGEG